MFATKLGRPLLSITKREFSISTLPLLNKIKAPLALHTLEGRYATALFNAAAQSKLLPNIETDLLKLQSQLQQQPNLTNVLMNPVMNRMEKEKLVTPLKKVCQQPMTQRFLQVVAENGRLDLLTSMIQSYSQLMRAHRGEVPVIVTTAKPLDNSMMDRIKSALTKGNFLNANQTMIVSNKINPAILGGMIVEVGDHTLDFSSATKIAKLSKALFTPV